MYQIIINFIVWPHNEKKTQSMWENLSIIAIKFATKKQLKDLTHMFF
jgi:hypothetical protein